MNKSGLALLPLAAWLLSACVVGPPGHRPEASVGIGIGIAVPALPLVVELGSDPYYSQGGYTYFYDNNRWRYAQSRSGPWVELPRSHYPREIRYRDRGEGRDRDGHRGRDDGKRGRDDDDRGRGRGGR